MCVAYKEVYLNQLEAKDSYDEIDSYEVEDEDHDNDDIDDDEVEIYRDFGKFIFIKKIALTFYKIHARNFKIKIVKLCNTLKNFWH